jgi:HAD superfamily hydrolase (TIGR01509 family)
VPDFEGRAPSGRANRIVRAPFSRTTSFRTSPGGIALPTTLPPPDGLVFDLDGTLVDTVPARIEGWLEALEGAAVAATREQVAPMIGMDGRRLAWLAGEAAGRRLTDDEAEAFDRAAGEAFDRYNLAPRPLPGVTEIIATLDELGLPWLIATSSRAGQVTRSVEALGLATAPTIVDGSQVHRAKPAPDLLLLAAGRLGVAPAGCWAVGDATWDVRAATAAGMPAVCVTAGSAASAEALRDAGAALVVASLDELALVVRRARLGRQAGQRARR